MHNSPKTQKCSTTCVFSHTSVSTSTPTGDPPGPTSRPPHRKPDPPLRSPSPRRYTGLSKPVMTWTSATAPRFRFFRTVGTVSHIARQPPAPQTTGGVVDTTNTRSTPRSEKPLCLTRVTHAVIITVKLSQNYVLAYGPYLKINPSPPRLMNIRSFINSRSGKVPRQQI